MRTLSIICVAVTLLQTSSGSQVTTGVVGRNNNAGSNPTAITTTRALRPGNKKSSDPNSQPGMNPDEQDSAELPKTIKESGKRVLKTAKSIANQRGVGLLNGFTGMLKGANGAFDFFGKFLQGRSNNVKDLAKESLNMASSFSDTATNGAKNVMNSARTIGGKGAKILYNTLQKTTSFGKNLTKLGGTVLNTPISVGEDLVSSVNGIAKVPSRLSRMASGLVKPVVDYLGPKSDEDESEEENDENLSDAEPPITPNTPPPSTPKKLIKKKP